MDNNITRLPFAAHRPALVAAAAFGVLALACLVGVLVDPRTLGGQPIWDKPLKFSVSFALYLGTFALLVPLPCGRRARRVARRTADATVVAAGVEITLIALQAARGQASHFNVATGFDTAVWAVMGSAAVTIWVLTAILAAVLLRERSLRASWHRAIGLGLLVSLVGMSVAFLMITPTAAQIAAAPGTGMPTVGAHAVGVLDGGPSLPLLGWSTTGGDLRIGHFVGLHALQALPVLALVLDVLARRIPRLRPEPVRARLVVVGAAAWLALTALLTGQALRGQSIVAPDAVTLAEAAALLVATLVAVAVVLFVREGRRLGWARWQIALLVVGSVVGAVSFTLPLFLALRERRLGARA